MLQQAVRLEFGLSFLGIHVEGLGPGLQNVDVPSSCAMITILGTEVNGYRALIISSPWVMTAVTC